MFRNSHKSQSNSQKTQKLVEQATLPVVESLEGRQLFSANPLHHATASTPGDSASNSPISLGTFNSRRNRSFYDYIGGSVGDENLYEVTVTTPMNLNIRVTGLRQDVQTQLQFADGTPINEVQNGNGSSELIIQRLDPGNYYIDMTTSAQYSTRFVMNVKGTPALRGSVAPQPASVPVSSTPSTPITPTGGSPSYTYTTAPSANPTMPAGLTPDSSHNLQYDGGYIIQNLQFANIYVGGSAWSASDIQNIDSALSSGMSDPVLNTVMQQYFSGQITTQFLGSTELPGGAPRSVSQTQLESYIAAIDSRGYLQGFNLNDTVLNFMLPPGTVLTKGTDNSLNGLGGFHGSVEAVGPNGRHDTIFYAVGAYSQAFSNGKVNGIPAFDQNWKNVVATFYHELNEARTDPEVEFANQTNDQSYCGWISPAGDEIGDYQIQEMNDANLPLGSIFCEVPLADGSGTVPIQLMWSNQFGGPVDPTGSAVGGNGSNWWAGSLPSGD